MDKLDLRCLVSGILHGEKNNDLDSLGEEPVQQVLRMSQYAQYANLIPWDCAKSGWRITPWAVSRKNRESIQTLLEYTLIRNAYETKGWINTVFITAKSTMPNFCTLVEYGQREFSVSAENLDKTGLTTQIIRIRLCEDTFNDICDKVFNKEFCDSLNSQVSHLFDEFQFPLDNMDEPICSLVPEDIIKKTKLSQKIDLNVKFKAYLSGSLLGDLRTGLAPFFHDNGIASLFESLVFNYFIHKKFLDNTNQPAMFNSFRTHALSDRNQDFSSSHILGGALACLLVVPRTFPSELLNNLLVDIHCASSAILAKIAVTQNRHWYKQSYELSIRQAISAIMSRNMSHNLGSHVLPRFIRESLANENIFQPKDINVPPKHFDPLWLVWHDANDALDDIAGHSDPKVSALTHRFGRALHYLEEIYLLCGQDTGTDKLREFANDTKVFAAYTQQRMDYIAQICTDWPRWTASYCLSNDLMAWFLKQRKVLNYIAASEGLKATRFDKNGNRVVEPTIPFILITHPNSDDIDFDKKYELMTCKEDEEIVRDENQKICVDENKCIRIRNTKTGAVTSQATLDYEGKNGGHIGFVMRLLKFKEGDRPHKPSKITPIMNFTAMDNKDNDKKIIYKDRIPIAFPGGKTGWHAFFVILEGLIRNVAKHGYSRLSHSHQKCFDLNIIIDIIDDGNTYVENEVDSRIVKKPAYTIRIYSNVDQNIIIEEGSLSNRTIKKDENEIDKKNCCKDKTWRWKWTSDKLNSNMSGAFVDKSGKTEKQNWGLSEFRINAGYLQAAEIMDIGGLQKDDLSERILRLERELPIWKEGCDNVKYKKITFSEAGIKENDDIDVFDDNDKPISEDDIDWVEIGYPDCDSLLLKPICNLDSTLDHNVYNLTENGFKVKCRSNKEADMSPRFYYEFKMLKPRIIGMEVDDQWKTKGRTKKEKDAIKELKEKRLSEGWEVYSLKDKEKASDRAFEYYILSSSENRLYEVLKMKLVGNLEYLKAIYNENSTHDDKQYYGHLDYYPGRLFVVLEDGNITIAKANADWFKKLKIHEPAAALWWQMRKRVCILSQDDFTTLKLMYDQKNERGEIIEGATNLARLFLQKKWAEHVLRNVRGFVDHGLNLYHYLNESDSSKNNEPRYVPDTTPFQKVDDDKVKKNEPIQLILSENGENNCALVFGRHYGVLEKPGKSLGVRTDRKNADYQYTDMILYAESMSGGASYFSQAVEVFQMFDEESVKILEMLKELKPNDSSSDEKIKRVLAHENIARIDNARTVYQFAETALLRVVLIDERIQEQFGKMKSDQLVGVSEQQVFVGYLSQEESKKSGWDFTQISPAGGLKETGYVKVIRKGKEKTCSVELSERTLRLNDDLLKSNRYDKLWSNEGDFEGDVLVIHQGIIDKWYEALEQKTKKTDEANELVKALKTKFPYVVVTSGRGRPGQDDLPPGVRFLPFSSFESAPQGTLYEKHPLVQQVLAIVEEEKNS